jgi:hypothetical protein
LTTDKDINDAIEAGRRNEQTAQLVRNWCAHVRIEKFGGVGLIEAETGLPIGHHNLACDHAGGGGMATWDLRDAALDFHDRYCVDCQFRKPVGFPTLATLVSERDQQREKRKREHDRASAEAAAALKERQAARAILQQSLLPLSAAIIDHIGDLDVNRTDENRKRITESARLAPEHFTEAVVSYILDLTDTASWFNETGLIVLDAVKADPLRITRAALKALARGYARTAARVLQKYTAHVEEGQLAPALPEIMHIAAPADPDIPMGEPPKPEPELLLALYEKHSALIHATIEKLLATYQQGSINLAARCISAIGEHHPSAFAKHIRTMVATYVRAGTLVRDIDRYSRGIHDLQDAIIAAFFQSPQEVDQLIHDYMQGASAEQLTQAIKLYERSVSRGRLEEHLPAGSKPHCTAFNRLLWAATTLTEAEPIRTVASAFSGKPYHLVNIARAEFDGLIGAMLLIDQRMQQHQTKMPTHADALLKYMEWANIRDTLGNLASSFARWAAIAAKSDLTLMKKMVGYFEHIPEDRESLRGRFLKNAVEMADSVDGLQLILPFLYHNLVCASPLLRAYAADALAEMPYEARQNMPPLVYEAFSVLLYDPYIVVHKAAVHALRRFSVPEGLKRNASFALLNIIRTYENNPDEARFVIEAISWLANELKDKGIADKSAGRYLVSVLAKIDPETLQHEIRWLARPLLETYGFIDVLLRIIPLIDRRDQDDELDLLADIPHPEILRRTSELHALGVALASDRTWVTAHIIEVLAHGGALKEARQLAEDALSAVPDTVQMRARRIMLQELQIAAEFEEALADSGTTLTDAIDRKWRDLQTAKESFFKDAEERRYRTGFPRSI